MFHHVVITVFIKVSESARFKVTFRWQLGDKDFTIWQNHVRSPDFQTSDQRNSVIFEEKEGLIS